VALKGVKLTKENPIPTALITIAVIVGGYILIKTIKK
jgi:hypothetical protein